MDGKIVARDGGRLELWGQTSLRELGLSVRLVAGTRICTHEDCCGFDDESEAELELDRTQVIELRDQLNAWLARGDI
jgi:hypothetical protein